MSDHLLHLDLVDGYGPSWRLTCEHVAGEPWEIPNDCACWFMTWWEGVGAELLKLDAPTSFPMPVRPSDDWDEDDGGLIIADGAL